SAIEGLEYTGGDRREEPARPHGTPRKQDAGVERSDVHRHRADIFRALAKENPLRRGGHVERERKPGFRDAGAVERSPYPALLQAPSNDEIRDPMGGRFRGPRFELHEARADLPFDAPFAKVQEE